MAAIRQLNKNPPIGGLRFAKLIGLRCYEALRIRAKAAK
jgi:hypothetical protein